MGRWFSEEGGGGFRGGSVSTEGNRRVVNNGIGSIRCACLLFVAPCHVVVTSSYLVERKTALQMAQKR